MVEVTDDVREAVAAEDRAKKTAREEKLKKAYKENWDLLTEANIQVGDARTCGVNFTQGLFSGIKLLLAHMRVEMWTCVELGGDRRRALEERVKALEARPAGEWRGVWKQGVYPECSMITDQGGLWVAKRSTTTRPGSAGSDWVLIVKSGGAPR